MQDQYALGPDGTRTLYRIRIGQAPDTESLTAAVRLTVTRVRVDASGATVGRAEKVRDPVTINGWSIAGAQRKAATRGKIIVRDDQLARGIRPTTSYRTRR